MNYTNLKLENTNVGKLAGVVEQEPIFSHEIEGEKFYEFTLKIKRLSNVVDTIPVTISERTLIDRNLSGGSFVEILGEYRSYNKLLGDKSKLILTFFAKEFELSQSPDYVNEIKLQGYICKEPIYRKTPFEREICDVLLAVNRPNYHKSDYIPCILWGRNARFIANQTIGAKVEIFGRIQSREYTKKLPDGTDEARTAYEVSCQMVSLVGNVSKIVQNKSDIENNAAF